MFIQKALAASVQETSSNVSSGVAEKIGGFFDYLIGQVPSWIAGFLLFVVTVIIAKIAKAVVEARIGDQVDEEHQEVLILTGRVTYFGVLTIGITVALKIAGIDLTTILAAVAFGVGFAMRDLISNFLAGVLILVGKQFAIGDFIKVGGTVGRVMEIQTRATIIKGFDGTKIIVPNAEIFTSQVVSYTSNPFRRVSIPLYISYDTDIKYAMKVALKTIKKNPKVLPKPAPSVIVKEYGDSSIDLTARFWADSHKWFKLRSELMDKLWTAFMEAGIVVPYDVMHIETNQDTATEWKEAAEITAKKQAEAKAKREAKKAILAAQAAQSAASQNTNAAVSTNTVNAPTQLNNQTFVPETIPIDPPAQYQDLEEIDKLG